MPSKVWKIEGHPEEVAQVTIYFGDIYTTYCHFHPAVASCKVSVDFGDGEKTQPSMFSGAEYSINHIYKTPGVFINKTIVIDDEGQTSSAKSIIIVLEPTTESIKEKITAGYDIEKLTEGQASVCDKLTKAQSYIDNDNYTQARNILQAVLNEVKAEFDISSEGGAALITQVEYLMATLDSNAKAQKIR